MVISYSVYTIYNMFIDVNIKRFQLETCHPVTSHIGLGMQRSRDEKSFFKYLDAISTNLAKKIRTFCNTTYFGFSFIGFGAPSDPGNDPSSAEKTSERKSFFLNHL